MAKASTPAIPSMVIKCLLMLSSDQDGEVVAASRAMKRALEKNGLSLHEVAAKLEGRGQPQIVYRDRIVHRDRIVYRDKIVYRDRPAEKVDSAPAPAAGYDPVITAVIAAEACKSILHALDLAEHEESFIKDMLERSSVTRRHFRMTTKQAAWFRRLAHRAGFQLPTAS